MKSDFKRERESKTKPQNTMCACRYYDKCKLPEKYQGRCGPRKCSSYKKPK